jgi:hypothetical protein
LGTTHKITYNKVEFEKGQTFKKSTVSRIWNKPTKTKTDSPNTISTRTYKHCIDQSWDCTNGLCNSLEQSPSRHFGAPKFVAVLTTAGQISLSWARRNKQMPSHSAS